MRQPNRQTVTLAGLNDRSGVGGNRTSAVNALERVRISESSLLQPVAVGVGADALLIVLFRVDRSECYMFISNECWVSLD